MKSEKLHRYIKILVLVVIFSFMWGAWWGVYRIERRNPQIKYKDSVRVLSLSGYLHPDFVSSFEKSNRIKLQITEMKSDMDILREALSHNRDYDLILISSYIAKSFIIDNVLTPLSDVDESSHRIENLLDISVDFKGMDYDPDNRYLVPVSWGVNGFLVNTQKISLATESLQELLASKLASVFDSPIELFNIIIKLNPIIKNWVETGQNEELRRDLRELRAQFKFFSNDPRPMLAKGALDVAQITNGQAANLISKDSHYRFVLPKDRATLWIYYWGISRGVNDLDTSAFVLNQLLKSSVNERLVRLNEQASVLETLNTSKLPSLQKANFIRQVPLSRVELFINHEALEQTWNNALQDEFFKTR